MVQHRTAPLYTPCPVTWQRPSEPMVETAVSKRTNQISSPWNVNTRMGGDWSWDTVYVHLWEKALLLTYLVFLSSGAFQCPIFRSSIDAGNYSSILLSNPISVSWLGQSISVACHKSHLNWFKYSEHRFYNHTKTGVSKSHNLYYSMSELNF